jgi:hypothetical protein
VKARLPPIEANGKYTFTDVIDRICNVCLGFFRQRLLTEEVDNALFREIAYRMVRQIEDIPLKAQPHLLSTANCLNVQQHVEYFAAIIYINHSAAHILQSTLPEPSQDHDDEHQISDVIVEKSMAIVEAFLRLRQLSILSSHYWSLLQASVTAAKTLMTRGRTADRPKMGHLVKALIVSLKSSCNETISVVNGFSTSLSQTVADLTMILES